jgi:hypothetical protein
MSSIPTFMIDRGLLLADAVCELGAQFSLPMEVAAPSTAPWLSFAQGELAEIQLLLRETLAPAEGSAAPVELLPVTLLVVAMRLDGMSRSVAAHAQGAAGQQERLALEWLASRAKVLSDDAGRLSMLPGSGIAHGNSAESEDSVASASPSDVKASPAQSSSRGTMALAHPESSTPVEAAA